MSERYESSAAQGRESSGNQDMRAAEQVSANQDGFHVGGGWWFVCEPGGFVRLTFRPGTGGFAGPISESHLPLMAAGTWKSVVDYVAGWVEPERDSVGRLWRARRTV